MAFLLKSHKTLFEQQAAIIFAADYIRQQTSKYTGNKLEDIEFHIDALLAASETIGRLRGLSDLFSWRELNER